MSISIVAAPVAQQYFDHGLPSRYRTRRTGTALRSYSERGGNGAAVAATAMPEADLEEAVVTPACPVPDLYEPLKKIALVNPLKDFQCSEEMSQRPLVVYFSGMDCTGQGIRHQLPSLVSAGFDVRCLYIPSSDRSSWAELVKGVLPLLEEEVKGPRPLTLVGESFGGRLALHVAQAAPHIVSQLVVVNPASNLARNNLLASIVGQTGLLGQFSWPIYEFAQDILLPLLVKRNRVSTPGVEDLLSPIDFVPQDCAAWRLSMLNDGAGLSDAELRSIKANSLIVTSAKDRILSSLDEGIRLQKLIPNSKRVILPESGHIALLEDTVDLVSIMKDHGLSTPGSTAGPEVFIERSKREKEAVPSDERMDELGKVIQPWRILTSPYVSGAENLPSASLASARPVLFVGNHTRFGVYDSHILLHELYIRGFRCRSLAHPGHWKTGFNPLFERYGSVKATKFEAYRLLKEGQHVLLFPGGAKEVCKRKGEEYKLQWKSSVDFVRMAIRFRAIIVPFAALGGDEAFKILFDWEDILGSPFGGVARQFTAALDLSTEELHPISAFPFTNLPSPVPLPSSIERIYFDFAEYLDPEELQIDLKDKEQCQALYLMARNRVEASIARLKEIRERDPERDLPRRMGAKVERLLPRLNKMKQ